MTRINANHESHKFDLLFQHRLCPGHVSPDIGKIDNQASLERHEFQQGDYLLVELVQLRLHQVLPFLVLLLDVLEVPGDDLRAELREVAAQLLDHIVQLRGLVLTQRLEFTL